MKICAIILTKNEEIHIERCILSLIEIVDHIVVIDSGSSDATCSIASKLGAEVLFNPWVNYSTQFNFGLSYASSKFDWILRIDADEFLSVPLRNSISDFSDDGSVDGIYFCRKIYFLGRPITHGSIYPAFMLRLFRASRGTIESRWMDEHICVDGPTAVLSGDLVDHNLNSLSWWTDKHNSYASREAVDLLNLEFNFLCSESNSLVLDFRQASIKRWIKEKCYRYLPLGFRALLYFLYRYFFRLGFMDGKEGTIFHFLQGFWYRYLVDSKVYEVRSFMRREGCSVQAAIHKVLGIRL